MNPETRLDPRFSSPDATPTPWPIARDELIAAKTYWLTTVRPDGRPHSTTIAGVWLDGAIHFTTGPSERKAMNIAAGNSHVLVTAGCSGWDGLDIVVEGDAVPVTDPDRLHRVASAFTEKYDDFFGLRVVDEVLEAAGAPEGPIAFEVRATKAFGFGKGDSFSQTRWRFVSSSYDSWPGTPVWTAPPRAAPLPFDQEAGAKPGAKWVSTSTSTS